MFVRIAASEALWQGSLWHQTWMTSLTFRPFYHHSPWPVAVSLWILGNMGRNYVGPKQTIAIHRETYVRCGETRTFEVAHSENCDVSCSWNIQTLNLPVVLYGCETWTSHWRLRHWPRVLENRIPREIRGIWD